MKYDRALTSSIAQILELIEVRGLSGSFVPMSYDPETTITISLRRRGYTLRVNSAEYERDNIRSTHDMVNSINKILLPLHSHTKRAILNYTGRLDITSLDHLVRDGKPLLYELNGIKVPVIVTRPNLDWIVTTVESFPVKWFGWLGLKPRPIIFKHDAWDNAANRKLTWF